MKIIKAYQGEPHEHRFPAICWHCQDVDGCPLGDIFTRAKTREGVREAIAKKYQGDASSCAVWLYLFSGYRPAYQAVDFEEDT